MVEDKRLTVWEEPNIEPAGNEDNHIIVEDTEEQEVMEKETVDPASVEENNTIVVDIVQEDKKDIDPIHDDDNHTIEEDTEEETALEPTTCEEELPTFLEVMTTTKPVSNEDTCLVVQEELPSVSEKDVESSK